MLWAVLACGVTLFLLALYGVPAPLVSAALNAASPQWPVQVDRLTYRPGRGWLAEDVRFYAPHNHVRPFLRFPAMEFGVEVWRGVRHGEWGGDLRFYGGEVDTNLGLWADDLRTDQECRVRGLQGRLSYSEGRMTLHHVTGETLGIRVRLNGGIDFSVFPPAEDRVEPPGRPAPRAAAQLARVLEYLEGFRFAETPELRMDLEPGNDPGSPVSAAFALAYDGGVEHRGFRFASLELRAGFRDRRLEVDILEVRETPERGFTLEGVVDLERERVTLDMTNRLQRYALEAVSPVSLDALLATLQVRVEGKSDFGLRLEDNPLDQVGESLVLEAELEEAFYKDTFFPELSFRLEKNGQDLHLRDMEGRLGRGKGEGPISGSVEVGGGGRSAKVALKGAFYPDQAISILGPDSERYVREWEFRGDPPEFELFFEKKDPSTPMRLDLSIEAEDAFCRGTKFQSLQGRVTFADRILRVSDIQAARGTHSATGEVSFSLDDEWVDLSIMSTFPPDDLTPFVGEEAVTLLRPVRFEGSSWVQMEGRVDLSGRHRHDLSGKFIFNRPTWSWVQFRFLSSSFALKGERLIFPDIDGKLVEGEVSGSLLLQDLFSKDAAFSTKLDVKKADLFKTITAATDTTDTPYKGKLTLDLDLSGRLRSTPELPGVESLNGKGEVAIREGTLFRIPLLLGLSRILSKVVRGFGYAAQTDFTADFTVKDGVIASKNLFLEGNVLSIAGDGRYKLGDTLRVNLKVQLLNRGLLSETLKVLTWPLRKLIEIRLTGTLDQPEWEPRNLPRELFGK